MELVAYIRLFRKWFWLIFLGAFLAGGASFLYRSRQPEMYQSTVTLSVGNYMEAPNPNSAQIMTGVQLAQTYVVLAETFDVLDATVKAGEFPVSAGQLGNALEASVVPETSLIQLTVTYSDPVLAADMANELAQQLILNSPSNLSPEEQQAVNLAKTEIERLTQELEQMRVQRDLLQSQMETVTDQAEIERLQTQLNLLADRINATSANIANFQNTITTIQQRTNTLTIVERARIPTSPTGTSVLSVTLLGAAVGAALAVGLALLIEYLDDTIRTPDEATQVLALPTLASISRFGKARDAYPKRLITYHDPGSPVSEEYRTLRTNLLFSSNGHAGKGVYVVTSPGPSEGKSVTTANLAVTMAMAGWRVLLVDADLRRPRIHDIFNLDNNVGLSTLLSAEVSEKWGDGKEVSVDIKKCLQETDIPGLRVIASGYIPLNPTEVLGSVAMQRWFQEFRSSKNVDIILFDTPPSLVVADSAVLASTIKAPVVMVIEAGHTRRAAALKAKEQFDQLEVEVKGVVLNSVGPRERSYGYGYDYYYYYSDSSRSKSQTTKDAR